MKPRNAAVFAALCLAATATSTMAQGTPPRAEQIPPPTPRKSDTPPVLWNFAALVIMGGAIFGANMIPSKRGHQD